MNRIEVSSSESGAQVDFLFPVNPTIYDPVDDAYVAENSVLHGPSIYQKRFYDSRNRTMEWKGHEVGWDDITSVVTYFRSIEGEIRYFNFKDLDDINLRWDTTDAASPNWKKARVITISTKPRPGGKLIYDYVKLSLQPEK